MKDNQAFLVVILAAGESKRFGSPKQLIKWQNELLVVSMINKVLECGIQPYIALGANFDLIYKHEDFLEFQPFVIPINDWENGLSESIKRSTEFAENLNKSGVVFLLCDQPLIDLQYFQRLFKEIQRNPKDIICTVYKDSKKNAGVPAYFPKQLFEKLYQLEGDEGAKKILMQQERKELICECALLDIDEPRDLAHVMKLTQRE